jgi:hypothetical protein
MCSFPTIHEAEDEGKASDWDYRERKALRGDLTSLMTMMRVFATCQSLFLTSWVVALGVHSRPL